MGWLLNKMNPYVFIKAGEFEWTSAICENGGKKPKWQLQTMAIDKKFFNHNLEIEMRDKDP